MWKYEKITSSQHKGIANSPSHKRSALVMFGEGWRGEDEVNPLSCG